jgi:hypothetical protein
VDAALASGDDTLNAEMDAFAEALSRPATTSITEEAFDRGLWQRGDVEVHLGAYIREVVRVPHPPEL